MVTEKQFWNFRALNYDEQIGPLYEQAYCRTAELSLKHLSLDANVLEFACGTGIVTAALAPHVAHIRAIDIADEMVLRAEKKVRALGLTNVDVSLTDLFDPSLPEGSFDAVMGFNVLLYIEDLDKAFARIQSLLKPGGIFLSASDCLLDKPTKVGWLKFWRSRTGKMPYVGFFSQKGLVKRIAKAGFTVLETENLFPAPPNLFIAAKK